MPSKIARSSIGIAAAAVVLALASPVQAQSNMGNWVANIAKSTYSPDPTPRSSTLTIATSGVTVDVSADGKTITIAAKGTTAQGKPLLNVQVYDKK